MLLRVDRDRDRPSRPARIARWYAVACLLALAAWVVVGDAWWLQPVNLFTFWWSLPGVLLLPVALVTRRRGIAVALAVPALVWTWSYGALFVPGRAPATPADLRVVTFNTFVDAPDGSHIEALVARLDPDVLLLQEVFPPREAELRATFTDRLPHHVVVQSDGGVGGVMVLSRYPVTEVLAVGEATRNSRETAVAVLDVDGRPLQVVPVHLISPCPSCAPSLTERLDLEADTRRAELALVQRTLLPGVPAINGGDFNSNERSSPYRQLTRAGFLDPHRVVGAGPGFTWPNDGSLGPLLRIDWVFTRGLDPVAAWVDDGGPSDHRPVVVDLAWSP